MKVSYVIDNTNAEILLHFTEATIRLPDVFIIIFTSL